jgi:UDPglucose 6-dehydrogenase
MNITVIGTGYVGLVSGVCYAELGHRVFCVDNDPVKIETLQNGKIPIYEPGLQELSVKNMNAGRLSYTTDLKTGLAYSDIVIIAVGTPQLPNGEADLQYIEAVAREIGDELNDYKVICIKSTIPVGTNEKVREIIRSRSDVPFDSASVPEFLREGSAVQDTLHPDRIVIGTDSERAAAILTQVHQPMTNKIVITDMRSAEMIKYAANAFLATKISFINEIANICEKVGADVIEVARGMGLDRRIGPAFLRAGIGYGGSCFPKDTKALIQIAGNVEYEFKLLKSVVEVNQQQRYGMIDKLFNVLGNLHSKTIGIWGVAFKPDTDDVREAPALEIVEKLLELGAKLKIYDPIAMDNFRRIFDHPSIQWCDSAAAAAEGSDALCLLTEWTEFIEADLGRIEAMMARPILIDGRNVFSIEQMKQTGFAYYPVGRPAVNIENQFIYEFI